MKAKKIISLIIALTALVGTMSGCGNGQDLEKGYKLGSYDAEKLKTVSDTSDLPDYDGTQIKVKYWHALGKSQITLPENDVIRPEIARVTGVTIDEENSFGTASGSSAEAELGYMEISKEYPELVVGHQALNELVEKDLLWDLTEYIPKYCPNIVEKYPQTLRGVWGNTEINGGVDGKIYAVPTHLSEIAFNEVYPDITEDDYIWFNQPKEKRGYVWVRDDILKAVYPEARNCEEIEDLYMQNGEFTKEEIMDVTFKGLDDFANFLYKVKALNINVNGAEVSPIYLYNGIDNWYLLNNLSGYLRGEQESNDYFVYFDKKEQKIKKAFVGEKFEELLKYWAKLLKDGVASKESLVDSSQVLDEKLIKGMYAVAYEKDPNQLPGHMYRYRKVYIDVPRDCDNYYYYNIPERANAPVAIFKNAVSEEKLIQILRYFDYLTSDVGQQLLNWGPRSANLWEEVDGKRKFVDSEIEDYMVYGGSCEKAEAYGLINGFDAYDKQGLLPSYMRNGKNVGAPALTYERRRSKEDTNKFFALGIVEPDTERIKANSSLIYKFSSYSPKAKEAWASRAVFEEALLKVMTAEDDATFNSFYQDFLKKAELSGYNDETVEEINNIFWEYNKDYKDNFK